MSMASDDLSERVRRLMPVNLACVEKKMFGGRAFMLNGNMLVCPTKEGALLVRIGQAGMEEALSHPGAEVMVMNGRKLRDFVVLPGDAIEDDDVLEAWLKRALVFVTTLPPK